MTFGAVELKGEFLMTFCSATIRFLFLSEILDEFQ